MKIALLSSGGRSLGLEYIAAYLKKAGHEVKVIFDPALYYILESSLVTSSFHGFYKYSPDIINQVINEVIRYKPDLIGFSVFYDTYGFACTIAGKIKEIIDTPIIFGGLHPSSVPQIVIQEEAVDYICVGEGEEAIVELADSLEKGKEVEGIANIWGKKNGRVFKNPPRALISDLDSLPFPYEGLDPDRYTQFYRMYITTTSRGCYNQCTYCYNSSVLWRKIYYNQKHFVRRRSVDNVVQELKKVKELSKIKYISFGDTIFCSDMDWLREFSKKYRREVNIPFLCEINSNYANEEMVDLLEEANCAIAELGLQTIGENLRQRVLKRFDTNEQIALTINAFKNSRTNLVAHIMLNLPGQDEKELEDTAIFLSKYSPDSISILPLQYFPKTEIIEIAREQGILSEKDILQIEENKQYVPFGIGNTFSSKQLPQNKNILRNKKLANLLLISRTFHPGVMRVLTEKKFYKYIMPLLNIYYFFYRIIVAAYKILGKKKRHFNFFTIINPLKFLIWRRLGRNN